MPPIQKLNQSRDFRRLYARGTSAVCSVCAIYYRKNRRAFNRIGITASTKIGNAVQRNRAKRLLTEAYRLLMPRLRPGYDLILVARRHTVDVKLNAVLNGMTGLLTAAGLVEKEQ